MKWHCFLLALLTVVFLCAPASAQDRTRAAAYVDGLFERYDTNSDGVLDADELPKISSSLKLLDGDSNGDGQLDRVEFLNFIEFGRKMPPPPAIDGVFDEWTDQHIVARDPVGDATGAFDIKTVSAVLNKEKLYLRIELAKPLTLQNGLPEDGTLLMKILSDHTTLLGKDSCREMIIDFRKRTALFYPNDHFSRGIKAVGWSELGFNCLPSYSSDNFELCIDAENLNDVEADVEFLFGSDYVKPFKVKQVSKLPSNNGDSFARVNAADFRIANLNTLQNGLADNERGPAIGRLIGAAKADIYCFQKEWKEPLFNQGTERFKANSVWFGGCAILTKLPIERIPMTLDRAVAGLVTLPNDKRVAVISAHFKCCGYAGSPEDSLRVQQAEQLIGEVKRMREGAFGEDAKEAPIVLIGDYNLVGSRTPLNKFNQAGLTDFLLRNPSDGSAYTWRGLRPDESFWPGRLDFLTHTGDLEPLKGFVLDTERMTGGWKKYGLQKNDSLASDHLMLIGDFRFVD